MYRDFVYLDIDRIQSIIAQLQKGVLEQVLEGKSKELEGKAGIAAGILSAFLPIQLEATVHRETDVYSSKILQDYAYTIALEALNREGLCVHLTGEKREQLPRTNGIFVLAQGSASILDYSLLKQLAENEQMLNKLSMTTTFQVPETQNPRKGRYTPQGYSHQRKDQSEMQKIWMFVGAIMGESVQLRFKHSDDVVFVGTLERSFLREKARDFIFKYGGIPRTGWTMLAQIGQITEPENKLGKLQQIVAKTSIQQSSSSTTTDIVNGLVEILNAFQESLASVSYPDIAVTPIAVYRELQGTR